MPLRCPPPTPAVLSGMPREPLAGRILWRAFQGHRRQPWFFASAPAEPQAGGRFDLPPPYGACYLATSRSAAVLEALQDFGEGLLPDTALQRRRLARIDAPDGAPPAARLTAAAARGLGVTAALWAGEDRVCTQAWADHLFRAGWRAVYGGISHDPAGRLRAVTLFDREGAHPPYDDTSWAHETERMDTADIRAVLGRHGITVIRSDPDLPFVSLEDTDLLRGAALE